MIMLADARVALQHAGAAPRPDDHRVRVEPIGVAGELSPAVREALQARLGEALARTHFEIVEPGDAHAQLVRTQVVAHGRDLDIAIELVERGSTRVIARVEEQCDTCGTVEAAETIGSLAIALSRQVELQQRSAVQVVAPRAPVEAPVQPLDRPIAARRPVRWGIGWAAL
ncbi:MAG: hypothetical protein IAG13_35240, partial [Deltaproteobacteria bacterium]|nr:hypothetical protein [Nannocystaceae bacterium]